MEERDIIEEFGHIWIRDIDQYALVRNSDFSLGYIIVNSGDYKMLIVSDNYACRYILDRMIEAGVRIVESIDDIKLLHTLRTT
jgi:hypothetical protein